MKRILVFVVSVFLCYATLAFADDEVSNNKTGNDNKVDLLLDSLRKDSLTFSSAYIEGKYTNKQLANFNLEFLRASDRVLDVFKKPVGKVVVCLALIQVNCGVMVALHEVGHGLRLKSFGIDYYLKCNGRTTEENFFNYCLLQMRGGGLNGGACGPANDEEYDKLYNSLDNNSLQNFNIIWGAGGMNNQMYFAERISDDIYERKECRRILPYYFYLLCRLDPSKYDKKADPDEDSDDPTGIIHAFQSKGRNDFKKGTIADAGLCSLFLSATTYSIFTKRPLKFHGFRVPDVFPYITTKGMSYKVVSGYEINKDLKLIFGFESVFKVEPATECSLGIDHITKCPIPMEYRSVVTLGQGLDLEASCTVPVWRSLSMGLGCEIYSCGSLQGQRHATANMLDKTGSKLDKDGYSCNVFAFMSYRY